MRPVPTKQPEHTSNSIWRGAQREHRYPTVGDFYIDIWRCMYAATSHCTQLLTHSKYCGRKIKMLYGLLIFEFFACLSYIIALLRRARFMTAMRGVTIIVASLGAEMQSLDNG